MSLINSLNTKAIFLYIILGAFMISCGPGRHAVSRGNYKNDDIYYATGKAPKLPVPVTTSRNKKKGNGAVTTSDMTPVVAEAYKWIGTRYKSGGHTKAGTDCSGMVWEIYGNLLSMKLPRTAWEQQAFCTPVNVSALVPGDLVFFSASKKGRVSHVGIYVGDGNMIHASTSSGVIKSALSENYYRTHYHSAGRVGKMKVTSPKELPTKNIQSRAAFEDLDDAITEKADSILSSFLD